MLNIVSFKISFHDNRFGRVSLVPYSSFKGFVNYLFSPITMTEREPDDCLDQNCTTENHQNVATNDWSKDWSATWSPTSYRAEPYVSMLVCGRTGIGKSALVNSLISEEVTRENDPGFEGTYQFSTESIRCIKKRLNNVELQVYDSPGLQDGKAKDEIYLDSMYKKCKNVDLVLFCMDMTALRFTKDEKESIGQFASKFKSTKFFERCVLVMTMANKLSVPPSQRSKIGLVEYCKNKYVAILEAFRAELIENNIPESVVNNIPAVAAGYIILNQEITEEDKKYRLLWYISKSFEEEHKEPPQDFLPELWATCFTRVSEEAQTYFLKATEAVERLTAVNTLDEKLIKSLERREMLEQQISEKMKHDEHSSVEQSVNSPSGIRKRKNTTKKEPINISSKQSEHVTHSVEKRNDYLAWFLRTLGGITIGGTAGGLGGAGGGALTGAAIGALGGPVTAAGGAIVGGIVGVIGGGAGGGVYAYKTAK